MKKRRRLAIAGIGAAATAAVVAAALVTAPTSHADVPAPYFATSGNASDPHITRCVDPSTNINGYCLYTSVDMGQEEKYPGNDYPMVQTKLYYSANGYSGWVDKGAVFLESTIEMGNGGWVPDDAKHLWAPAAIKDGSTYYEFVPDVTDISTDAPPNIHTSSRIAVAIAPGPFGPYTYQGRVDATGQYMSDPDVVLDGTTRILFWANGDHSTCGGFSAAQLESDWRTTVDHSIVPIDIEGVEVLGSCDPAGSAGPIGRPYMEGASVYKTGTNEWRMYFAVKPTSVPAECATGVGGPGTANEAIAWATATSYSGTWTYQGIVMCGSADSPGVGGEWTNQATVTKVSNNRTIIVYHDAGTGDDLKERNLHAECLYLSPDFKIIAGVYRQALNAANGFNDCMAGTNANYWGLHMDDPQNRDPNTGKNLKPPIIRAPSNGTALTASRYAVGPWERYRKETVSTGVFAYKALSNGKYLCTPNSTTAITASCSSTSDTGATWTSSSVTGGGFHLRSVNNSKYISVAGNGQLYASATGTSTAAIINHLYMGGKSN